MGNGGLNEEEKPVGELFGRLIDEGKAYAKAELSLAKASAEAKARAAKKPALLGFAAYLFLHAGVIVLCMTVALALATLVGPLAGGAIASAIAFGVAGILGLLAKKALESDQ